MSKRWRLILYSVAAFLRFGFVALAPGWYDEHFTLLLTRLPLRAMLLAAAGDVHPPLWYLLLWPLGQAHVPVWVLRIPAAIFSLLALWLFERLLAEMDLTPRVRAAALVLMAVLPTQLNYAIEARMYSLLTCLVLLGCLSVLRRNWGMFGLACVLMLYTQYYGIFYMGALAAVGMARYGRGQVRAILQACVWACVGFLPWVIGVMLPQMGMIRGTYWMQLTGPGMVLRTLFQSLFMQQSNALLFFPLMLGGFAWLIAGIGYSWRHPSRDQFAANVMAFAPLLMAVAVSLIWQPVIHHRPLIAAGPFWCILLAGPVEWITTRRRALYAALYALPVLIISSGSMYVTLPRNKTAPVMLELDYITAHWQAGDIVYITSDDSWINGRPYTSLPVYKSPDCGIVLGGLTDQTRRILGQVILPLDQIPHTRAWFVWSDSPVEPPCNLARRPSGAPLVIGEQDEYIFDGLWLVK